MRKSLFFVAAVSLTISCQTIDPEKYARAPATQRIPIAVFGTLDLRGFGVVMLLHQDPVMHCQRTVFTG